MLQHIRAPSPVRRENPGEFVRTAAEGLTGFQILTGLNPLSCADLIRASIFGK
jgi:hypothetical protein